MENIGKKSLRILTMALSVVGLLATAIPVLAAEVDSQGTSHTSQSCVLEKLNVNTASVAALSQIPGIRGDAAFHIVQYRTAHGPFQSYAELLRVKGVDTWNLDVLKKTVGVRSPTEASTPLVSRYGAYSIVCSKS